VGNVFRGSREDINVVNSGLSRSGASATAVVSAPEAMIKAVSNAPGNKHIRIEETRTSMRIANHDNRLVFLQRARTAVNWVSTSSMHLPCRGPTNTRRGR